MDEPPVSRPRFRTVGEVLRERRSELGLDLNQIGDELRIKPAYLAAIEQGRSHDLPGAAYAIGFVRAYADHLGLDPDKVLDRFRMESTGLQARADLSLPVPLGERSLPGAAMLMVAVILGLCGYGTWYYLSTGDRSRPERIASVPATLRGAPPLPGAAAPPTGTADVASTTASTGDASRTPSTLASGLASAAPTLPDQVGAPAAAAPPASSPSIVAPTGLMTAPAAAAPSQAATNVAAAAPAQTGSSATQTPPITAAAPGSGSAAVPATGSTAAPAAANGKPTAVAAAAPAPAPGSVAAPATAVTTGSSAAGRVEIKAVADCWIQVRGPDQAIVFSRVLKTGEVYRVPNKSGLYLRTGNAGALEISVDGKSTPSIGSVGTMRRNVTLEPDALVGGTAVQG